MSDDQRMAEEWIVQVEGREYGPVQLQILREWKEEGRVLPTNQARRAEASIWIQAGEIPGLFDSPIRPSETVTAPREPIKFGRILRESFRIYRQGFFQFLFLTLLVIVPSVCGQLTGAVLNTSSGEGADFRTVLAAGFALCMLLFSFALWPIYISGIQLLTGQLKAGQQARFFWVLNEAIKFWPRVLLLCVFVYGSYLFWTIVPVGLILIVAMGVPSVGSLFLALLILAFQVWIVGRLYINFMFWQQFAVLAGNDAGEALRSSKMLARSQRNLVWYKRPLWRGVFISSLWFLFVMVLDLPLIWPALRFYTDQISVSQDMAQLAQAFEAYSKNHGVTALSLAVNLFQKLLRPLLGIAFVLIYFDATGPAGQRRGD
jgi:hypothetical protein